MNDRTPKAGEFYRHFKNKMYQVIGVATHSETREKLVIYQALYDDFGIYARPLEMFISEVDHVKYPEVTQKYRFEKIDMTSTAQNTTSDTIIQESPNQTSEDQLSYTQTVSTSTVVSSSQAQEQEDDVQVNPKLLEFLDAETFDEKYNVLVSMRDEINDKLIDDIAVVMDVIIEDGDLMKRYDDLKFAIRTRQKYEYSNRLR
ncbi:MAG: DUF1653 domain-containing protein [Agathobacter sp.]|nr:DUF1653 domain-containing protein [Agathobacter sp.]